VVFRKYFVSALLACALLPAACDPQIAPSATVGFITPTNGSKVPPGPVPVRIKCAVYNCRAESVVLRADGVRVGSDTAGYIQTDTCEFTWDASAVVPGSQSVLKATVYFDPLRTQTIELDSFSSSIQVLVDTIGPRLRIVSPQDGDTLNQGNVPIAVWAKNNGAAGMDRVEFLVDEELKGTATSGEQDTWRYTWDASQASLGSHAIKAEAYNTDGEVAFEEITIAIRGSGGPTYHHGYVDTSETWSPGGNPHILDGDVGFRYGAWLTVEPGCIVKSDGFTIRIGYFSPSGMKAIGTASAPIVFTSNQTTPTPGDWTGLAFEESTLAGTRLSFCTIEYAGYAGIDGAAISILNGGAVDEIDNCTIRKGGYHGVFCRDNSTFGSFHDNKVTENRSYPLRIGPRLAERLDANNMLTGNDSTGVSLFGRCSLTTTWPDLGVPYVIKDVTVGDVTNNPVLTIEPNTEVRFRKEGYLAVGNLGGTKPGRIIADGSAGPIKFTSLAATPAPGDFYGVSVYENASAESEFRGCEFSYGGGTGGDNGLLFVHKSSPEITGCDFGCSKGWGITFRTSQIPDTAELKRVNTFHDNANGEIKWSSPFPGN